MAIFSLNINILELSCPLYNLPSNINICLRISLFSDYKWSRPHKAQFPISFNENIVFKKHIEIKDIQIITDNINEINSKKYLFTLAESIVIELLQFSDFSGTALRLAEFKTYLYDLLFPLHLASKLVAKKPYVSTSSIGAFDEQIRNLNDYYPKKLQQSLYMDKGEYLKTFPKIELVLNVEIKPNLLSQVTSIIPTHKNKEISVQNKSYNTKGILKRSVVYLKKNGKAVIPNTSLEKRPPFVIRKVPDNIFSINKESYDQATMGKSPKTDKYSLLDHLQSQGIYKKIQSPKPIAIRSANHKAYNVVGYNGSGHKLLTKSSLPTQQTTLAYKRPASYQKKYAHIESRYKSPRRCFDDQTPRPDLSRRPRTTKAEHVTAAEPEKTAKRDLREEPGSVPIIPVSGMTGATGCWANVTSNRLGEDQMPDPDTTKASEGGSVETFATIPIPHSETFCTVCKLYRKYTKRPYWAHHGRCCRPKPYSLSPGLRDGGDWLMGKSAGRWAEETHTNAVDRIKRNGKSLTQDDLSPSGTFKNNITSSPSITLQRIQLDRLMKEVENNIQ